MDTPEYMQMIRRCIKSLGIRVGEEDPTSLRYLIEAEKAVQTAKSNAVYLLRHAGFTDVEIGEQLGMTRQAVQQRWPRPEGGPVGAGARWVRR